MTFSLLAIATLASGLLIGLIPTLVDGVKAPLRARLNLSESQLDWVVRLFYLTWLPAMPLAGWLLDIWFSKEPDIRHYKDILFIGLIALVLGIAWLALARSHLALLLNAPFLGLAYSFVTTATVRLMTVAFFTNADDATRKLNIASLNLGFIAVGLGALLGPWIILAIERWWGYRHGLLYLSILLILPAALTVLADEPKTPAAVSSWEDVLTHPQLALIVGIILVYFAIENCLEFWPESYLKELGYQERGLHWGMLFFWLAFIATRAGTAWWLYMHPAQGFGLTLVLVIVSACILGNLVGGYEIGSGSFGFWMVGACYGPLLPCFLGIALDMRSEPLPTSALGALLALSGLDTLFMRPLMNVFGKGRSARAVMCVPTVLALLLATLLLFLWFLRD